MNIGTPEAGPDGSDGVDDHETAPVADEHIPGEHEHSDDDAQAEDDTPESTSSGSDAGADAEQAEDSKPDGEKPAKVFEPYEVPSFGHHFFCHDDRYMQSNRGRGRGRGGCVRL